MNTFGQPSALHKMHGMFGIIPVTDLPANYFATVQIENRATSTALPVLPMGPQHPLETRFARDIHWTGICWSGGCLSAALTGTRLRP